MANSHLQAAILSSTFLIPWPGAPLEMLARPLPANQIPWRRECSDGSYQVLVIKLNPGLVMLSNTEQNSKDERGCENGGCAMVYSNNGLAKVGGREVFAEENLTKPMEPERLEMR